MILNFEFWQSPRFDSENLILDKRFMTYDLKQVDKIVILFWKILTSFSCYFFHRKSLFKIIFADAIFI